jgi:hypothetical protein
MNALSFVRVFILLGLCAIELIGCHTISNSSGSVQSIVGAWLVTIPEAPFQHHMMIFHADGTLVQSNPDAGDPHTSDSNGMGVWVAEGDHITGKFVELTADRLTHQFVSRGEIAFSIHVQADNIRGNGNAFFFDANGAPSGDPIAFTLSGSRIHAR